MNDQSGNWSLCKAVQNYGEKRVNCKCAFIGSCNLHTLNNAFRKGVLTKWGIASVSCGLNWLVIKYSF